MSRRSASELVQVYWPVVVSVAAAIGATIMYVLKERPLLMPRVGGGAHLTWATTAPPAPCRANFAVSLKNTGTTELSVNKVRVRTWLLNTTGAQGASAATVPVSYVDLPKLMSDTPPATDLTYQSGVHDRQAPVPLVAHYFADMQYNHSFEWDVPRSERRRFHVLIEFFAPGSTQTDWYFTAWSPACGVSSGS
jgi:hypothetical protein